MEVAKMTVDYPLSKFQSDNDLTNPSVMEKYKIAGNIVNVVLEKVLARIVPGVSVFDVCDFGDQLIRSHTKDMYKNSERGVAAPTCVTVNNYVQYFSPLLKEDYILKAGDLVKVELGAHIDGYIATAAHTLVIIETPGVPVTGRAADVICATYTAFEAAMRLLRPGVKASQITKVVGEIATYYRCQPVVNSYSSLMKRFVLRAGKDIENRFADDLLEDDLAKKDFEISTDQVYQLNVVLSSGDGKTRVSDFRPFVYQRDVNQTYQLKTKAARSVYQQINTDYSVFPFATRALTGNDARVGLSSLVQHELVQPFYVMQAGAKDLVAQFKATVLVTKDGAIRITLPQTLSYVHSQYCIPESTDAANILQMTPPEELRKPKVVSTLTTDDDGIFGMRRAEASLGGMDIDL